MCHETKRKENRESNTDDELIKNTLTKLHHLIRILNNNIFNYMNFK